MRYYHYVIVVIVLLATNLLTGFWFHRQYPETTTVTHIHNQVSPILLTNMGKQPAYLAVYNVGTRETMYVEVKTFNWLLFNNIGNSISNGNSISYPSE